MNFWYRKIHALFRDAPLHYGIVIPRRRVYERHVLSRSRSRVLSQSNINCTNKVPFYMSPACFANGDPNSKCKNRNLKTMGKCYIILFPWLEFTLKKSEWYNDINNYSLYHELIYLVQWNLLNSSFENMSAISQSTPYCLLFFKRSYAFLFCPTILFHLPHQI